MLTRILEPEVMDAAGEAAEYDAMDHREVNRLFVSDLLELLDSRSGSPWRALDLGTGTALIPIELCQCCPDALVTAVDASAPMLEIAEQNVARAGLADRITLSTADANTWLAARLAYDAVIHNSLVHHLPNPAPCLAATLASAKPGGVVFVRDLMRPADQQALDRLVELHTRGATPRQQALFAESLGAALTLDEAQQMVADAGGDSAAVTATSDRHWTWRQRLSDQ